MSRLGQWLGAWPGRLESPGHVKRRLLVVAVVAGLAIGGAAFVTQATPGRGPFTEVELRDMSGLPQPPVRFVQDADGTYRELTAEELEQLRQLQELIRNFPAPQNLGGGFQPTPAADADAQGEG